MSKHFVTTALLLALLSSLAPGANAAINLDQPIPVGPQVKVGKLANGLTYYIQQNSRPAKKLELRLVVKAGSVLEDDDQQGIAHVTEHMAFNGSTHFKKHELVSYLQSIGVGFGADLNAYTTFDETVYILPIPTDRKENIEQGFLVLEDWAHGLSLNDADIDKERDIVLEELRLGKGADDRMNKVLLPKLFNGSKYAKRLPIGKEETVKNFKVAALKRFYHDWYRPDLMAVVAVGDVDPATLEKMINEHFGALTNPQHERPRNYPRMTRRAATEALVITDPEADGNSVLIRYPVQEMIDQSTYREYRRLLVESLFATMLNQRLQELTQLPNPPFLNGGSAMGRLVARYKSFTSSAALGERGAAPAIDALVQENERARKYGFSVAELERGKKNMLRSYEREYNEREKSDSSSYVGEYLRHFLENEAIPGIAREYEVVQELIPGISLDELNHFARDNVPANAAKLVVYMGSSKPGNITPAKAQLLASVAAAEKAVVRARDEKIVAENLMDKPPVPGSIVAESTDATLGLTRLTLSNGVKVILKPTDFRNDQVILSAVRFGGQSLFDDKDIFNARYASTILGTMGVANYAPLEVQKILAGKAVSVNVGLNNYTDNVSGTAGSSEIETMLQLVYLKMTSVRRDDDLFKSYVTRQAEAARNNMAQPEAVFRDSIVTTLYANNPRVPRAPRPDDFAKLSLDRSLDIYRQRFSSAKDLTFILVGSFDVATIKPLLATYLASLPTPDIPVAFRDVGVRPIKGVIKKQVRSGTEAKSDVSINFSGEAIYSEQEQLRFHAMLDVMNIRITDILREKMALIYGGGVSGSLNKFPYANYSIGASLPTGPDKVDKVIAATFAEIERMKEQGPDQSDLDKVKENWLQSYQKSLRENSYWAGRLQSALTNGTDPATILQYDKQVAALTPADLKEAARRYFDLNNYVQVVLQPEK